MGGASNRKPLSCTEGKGGRGIGEAPDISGLKQCALCLWRVGFGRKLIARFTGVPRTTVRRVTLLHRHRTLERGPIAWGRSKRSRAQEGAWAREWAGQHKWDQCRHWVKYFCFLEYSRKRSNAIYRALDAPGRRDWNRKVRRSKELSGYQIRYIQSDGYIRDKLRHGTNLIRSDIPQSVVALKREHLRLKRLLKNNTSESK